MKKVAKVHLVLSTCQSTLETIASTKCIYFSIYVNISQYLMWRRKRDIVRQLADSSICLKNERANFIEEERYRLKPPPLKRDTCKHEFPLSLRRTLFCFAKGRVLVSFSLRQVKTGLTTGYYLAEEERFELSREIAPPYSFSKAAPSATWVLLLVVINFAFVTVK